MNPWEACALDYRFTKTKDKKGSAQATDPLHPPSSENNEHLFYPGLYCPSGLDVMTVLFRIFARPNPAIDLGPVDGSVSLVVCDLALADTPIVYASDAFLALTGYSMGEIRGRNCRFLQAPPGDKAGPWAAAGGGGEEVRPTQEAIREAIRANREHQTEILNFKKGGEPFVNILTVIPITWDDGADFRYSVGFQCQKE